jgi:2Fe-2S ferredoxin
MQAIREAGLPIAADCGGACTCATCHIYVDRSHAGRLPLPGVNEAALLGAVDDPTPLSRLSCQIELARSMNGIKVTLAPGSY